MKNVVRWILAIVGALLVTGVVTSVVDPVVLRVIDSLPDTRAGNLTGACASFGFAGVYLAMPVVLSVRFARWMGRTPTARVLADVDSSAGSTDGVVESSGTVETRL